MHTDTIFYQIFLTFHTLLFELLGQPTENAEGYQFTSVEVKEKAFRFDGIFMPDSLEKLTNYQQELVNSGRIKRIYLDELPSG
jgi:predicted transposase YdaD